MAEGRFVVVVLLDGTLNIDACGPYRIYARAEEAAARINDAGEWSSDSLDEPTIIAQVVRLSAPSDLVARAHPQSHDSDPS